MIKTFYEKLQAYGSASIYKRWLTYFIMGWLSLVGLKPGSSPSSEASGYTLLLLPFALVFILAFLGAFFTAIQPLLSWIGALSLESTVILVVLYVNAIRVFAGRKLFNASRINA